jgi:hypothetical protein
MFQFAALLSFFTHKSAQQAHRTASYASCPGTDPGVAVFSHRVLQKYSASASGFKPLKDLAAC